MWERMVKELLLLLPAVAIIPMCEWMGRDKVRFTTSVDKLHSVVV